PFATIEPNVGVVPVPDYRLQKLAEITKEEEKMTGLPPIKPATVEFVDIAGLVKGAAEGAGLGNKFLSHIREVSVIAHVVRAFVDDNIIREGSSDPEADFATITTELILADLQSLQKQDSAIKSNDPKKPLFRKLIDSLNTGIPVRNIKFTLEEEEAVKQMFLLTKKPELVVLNISEDEYSLTNVTSLTEKYANILQLPKDKFVVICAKIESELSELGEEDQTQYLKDLGFPTSGLERLIQKAYENLGLISFLTSGVKEVRAWTIKKGSTAVEAAGEIHTDFMKKFIKAEVVSYPDFTELNGWKGSREKGKARLEGKDYIMNDGDVVEFKIGA
ncbi:MAG: redox-regulated ATPase YchF, partial [Patescibacteria group bacterium]|nr:redox-regulated ATPase YchF [Patescibacteria group bacterium]